MFNSEARKPIFEAPAVEIFSDRGLKYALFCALPESSIARVRLRGHG
jgi:hypothetical protein